MPDFGSQLFGSPAGMRQADADMQAKMLNTLSAQEATQRIQQNEQMNPLRVQQQQQENQQRQRALDHQKQMQALMARVNGQKPDPDQAPETFTEWMDRYAETARSVGMFDEAMKVHKLADESAFKEEETRTQQANQMKASLEASNKDAELVGRMANGVLSRPPEQRPEAFKNSVLDYYQKTGKGLELLQQPYSDDLVKEIAARALTAKQQGDLLIKAQDEQSKEENRKSAIAHRKAGEKHWKAIEVEQNRHHVALEKAGGGGAKAPTFSELTMASALVKLERPGLSDEERMVISGQIASLAKEKVNANKALNWGKALSQAWEERKGDISDVSIPSKGLKGSLGGTEKKSKFMIGPGAKSQPIDAMKGEPQAPKEGAWYWTPKSVKEPTVKVLRQWNGTGYIGEKSSPSASDTAPQPDSETDEGEEIDERQD